MSRSISKRAWIRRLGRPTVLPIAVGKERSVEGVPEQCETYYKWHQEVYGREPGRNAMQRAPELRDFTEHAIRTSWEILSGKRRPPRRYTPKQQKETVVEQR